LTRREREVATHVAQGMSNRAIATALFIAEKTVEMHVSSCLSKFGFTSRTQLATWVAAQGLLPAPQTQG
jgi:non-specific serine/threonine protein kinase